MGCIGTILEMADVNYHLKQVCLHNGQAYSARRKCPIKWAELAT